MIETNLIAKLTSLPKIQQFLLGFGFYLVIYIFWYDVLLNPITANKDIGSLIFLPHGARFLVIAIFGWIGFWAIFFGALLGPLINEEIVKLNSLPWENYLNIWHNLESFSGALCVLLVLRFLHWAKIIDRWRGDLFIHEPSKLMLIIFSSACINGLLTNFITSQSSLGVETSPIRVIRYVAGDIVGATYLLIFCYVGYKLWLRFIR